MSSNIATSAPERHTSAAEHSRYRALSRTEAAHLFGPDGLREALARREWVELWPGVVVPGRCRNESTTRGAAALLRAGPAAVLSGLTAAALHGCSTGTVPVTEVTIPYDRQLRSRSGLAVRQASIRESEVVELDGLRVHALDVALAELLCGGPQRRALACLEQALGRLPRASAEQLRGLVAERIDRRVDRRGTRRATALLELARDPTVERESLREPAERLSSPP
ncbi:hypothetical protein [Halosaccharopolyspora lacisalsi]|nr:hypothetical protein [Halosaccharopolyspora lacisalsi]